MDFTKNTIGDFGYVKSLQGLPSHDGYEFALYSNGSTYAIGKFWHKGKGGLRGRAALCREIDTYKVLTLGENWTNEVGVPQLYAYSIEDDVVWMLTQYIVSEVNKKLIFADYLILRSFLKELGEREVVKKNIGKWSRWGVVFGFPLLLLFVLARRIKDLPQLYEHFKNYICLLPLLFNTNNLELCHLDLRSDNVLYCSDRRYLIDFQSAAYAPQELDFAFSLDRALLHNELSEECANELLQYVQTLPQRNRNLVSLFFVYGLLFDLVIEKENKPADNYKYLLSFKKLIQNI